MSYLNNYQIEQIRQCIESPNWPLSCDEWPINLNTSTNCLAFALGLPIANPSIFKISTSPFSKLKDLIEHLLNVSGLEYRRLNSVKDAEKDEIIIQGYESIFDNTYCFHVIRRNLDGKWYHKPGFLKGPIPINSFYYMANLYKPENICCIFAVKKKAS